MMQDDKYYNNYAPHDDDDLDELHIDEEYKMEEDMVDNTNANHELWRIQLW